MSDMDSTVSDEHLEPQSYVDSSDGESIEEQIVGGISDTIDEIEDGLASSSRNSHALIHRMQDMSRSHQFVRQAVTYICFGAIASSIDITIFSFLIFALGLDELIANIVSTSVGLSTSFALNRWKTFNAKDHVPRRIACFFTVGLIGLCISETIIAILVDSPLDALPAKIMALIVAGTFQFLANKFISFRQ